MRGTTLTHWQRIRRWSLIGLVLWVGLTSLMVLACRVVDPPFSALMFTRWLERGPTYRERQCAVSVAALPDHVVLAVIAAEDQRFPQHFGFDLIELQAAIDDARDGGRLRGASTISQQVAKNLFLWNGRSFVRKGLEAYFTVLVEALLPKRRIVELYLSIAELGDGVFGFCAASRVFFGTEIERLSVEQAALLAAALPNPHRLTPAAPSAALLARQRRVIRQMRNLGPGILQPWIGRSAR